MPQSTSTRARPVSTRWREPVTVRAPAEEGQLHGRIVTHRGGPRPGAVHDAGHDDADGLADAGGRVPRRARRPGPARRRARDRRARRRRRARGEAAATRRPPAAAPGRSTPTCPASPAFDADDARARGDAGRRSSPASRPRRGCPSRRRRARRVRRPGRAAGGRSRAGGDGSGGGSRPATAPAGGSRGRRALAGSRSSPGSGPSPTRPPAAPVPRARAAVASRSTATGHRVAVPGVRRGVRAPLGGGRRPRSPPTPPSASRPGRGRGVGHGDPRRLAGRGRRARRAAAASPRSSRGTGGGARARPTAPGGVDPARAAFDVNRRVYASLGADLDALGVRLDPTPRPGRPPVPVAFTTFGGTPASARRRHMVARRADGARELRRRRARRPRELVHETGHAIHIAAIRTRPAFADWPDSDALTEALADSSRSTSAEPAWQRRWMPARRRSPRRSRSAADTRPWSSTPPGRCSRSGSTRPGPAPDDAWTEITSTCSASRPTPSGRGGRSAASSSRTPATWRTTPIGAVLAAALRAAIRAARGDWTGRRPGLVRVGVGRIYRFGLERPRARSCATSSAARRRPTRWSREIARAPRLTHPGPRRRAPTSRRSGGRRAAAGSGCTATTATSSAPEQGRDRDRVRIGEQRRAAARSPLGATAATPSGRQPREVLGPGLSCRSTRCPRGSRHRRPCTMNR